MTKYLLTSTTTTASKRVGRVGMRVLVGARQRVGVGNAQLLRASSGFLRFRSFSSSSSSSSSASNSSSSSSASASASSSSSSIWDIYNDTVHGKAISELPEVQASNRIKEFLTDKINSTKSTTSNNSNENSNKNNIEELLSNKYKYIPSQNDYLTSLKSIMMTYILNKNARIAALVGKGYYTIGPCGEENLSIIGCLLRDNNSNNNETNTDVDAYADADADVDADVDSNNLEDSNVGLILGDSSALHYRHTSISLTRQLKEKLGKQQLNNNDNSKHSGNDENEHNNNENNDNNNSKVLKELLLGRARGYTVSKYDPVTGGVHCSIGSGSGSGSGSSSNSTNEYVVSSTLASQCPSAIGRALGYSLLPKKKKKSNSKQKNSISSNQSTASTSTSNNPISFVTLGDGSIHNSHFLSSVTLAKHARHNNIKCPIVFGISDNGLSISYKTNNFISQEGMFNENNNNTTTTKNNKLLLLPVFHVNDSNDTIEIYSITKQAFDYSRKKHAPTLIVYKNIVRRFGHASTDRQYEYLTSNEIYSMSKLGISSSSDENENNDNENSNTNSNYDNENENNYCNVIQSMIQAVDILEYTTYEEILNDWNLIEKETKIAFKQAMSEPKVSLQDMMNNRLSAPLTPIIPIPLTMTPFSVATTTPLNKAVVTTTAVKKVKKKKKKIKKEVMRKHMTRVIEEIMEEDEYVVYIGEDVRHGGYYLITDGIYKKFGPLRIIDFPPDETTLLGCGLGFSQLGIIPIIEIPYIKYFDCGIDIFYEIAIQYWLTNGNSSNSSGSSSNSSSGSGSGSGSGNEVVGNEVVGNEEGEGRNEQLKLKPIKRNGGMIIRLQGFDRGIFGGNFHTHNSLSHIPPGVDVVCYSNGPDYVRGMRYAYYQAKYSGRIIVFVDCTHILNLRHVVNTGGGGGGGGDRAWEFPYPSLYDDDGDDDDLIGKNDNNGDGDGDDDDDDGPRSHLSHNNQKNNSMLDFEQVIRYRMGHEEHPFIREEIGRTYRNNDDDTPPPPPTSTSTNDNHQEITTKKNRKVAIVTYGNGVVTSLQARKGLLERQDDIADVDNDYDKENSKNDEQLINTDIDIDIIDCPFLSDVPKGLEKIIGDYDYILFADICKEGPGSNIFSSMITTLQQKRKLLSTSRWQFIGAPRTYNPLGSCITFLNQGRIENAVMQMLKDDDQ